MIRSVLINRNYTWLWIGQVLSAIGDVVFSTSLLIWIDGILLKGDSLAPIASGAVFVIIMVTTILVGPSAGVFVERWDKKRVMLRADLARAAVMLVFTMLAFALGDGSTVPMAVLLVMAVLIAANTAIGQFFAPARFVLIRDVVPEEHLGKASGYAQSSQALTAIVGPTLAATLVAFVGRSSSRKATRPRRQRRRRNLRSGRSCGLALVGSRAAP